MKTTNPFFPWQLAAVLLLSACGEPVGSDDCAPPAAACLPQAPPRCPACGPHTNTSNAAMRPSGTPESSPPIGWTLTPSPGCEGAWGAFATSSGIADKDDGNLNSVRFPPRPYYSGNLCDLHSLTSNYFAPPKSATRVHVKAAALALPASGCTDGCEDVGITPSLSFYEGDCETRTGVSQVMLPPPGQWPGASYSPTALDFGTYLGPWYSLPPGTECVRVQFIAWPSPERTAFLDNASVVWQ